MKQLLLRELIKPFVRRLGSIMAGALLSFGFAEDQAIQLSEALMTIGLIAIDLVSSYWERKE